MSSETTSRAIAGLSMGGFEALSVGLNHPARFAAVGAFSSGLREGFESQFPHLTAAAAASLKTPYLPPIVSVGRPLCFSSSLNRATSSADRRSNCARTAAICSVNSL